MFLPSLAPLTNKDHRTALEYCKLLLTLDPSDPFAVHLTVDYFAMRAKEWAYVIRFAEEYNAEGLH